jgi:hypothetical protein
MSDTPPTNEPERAEHPRQPAEGDRDEVDEALRAEVGGDEEE